MRIEPFTFMKYMFTFGGIALMLWGYFSYQNTRAFLSTALTTEGVVLELLKSRGTETTSYYPKVRFITVSGHEEIFVSPTGSYPSMYDVGENVTVLYQNHDPNKAKIKGFFSLWGLALIPGFIGWAFFVVGASLIIMAYRDGRQQRSSDQRRNFTR